MTRIKKEPAVRRAQLLDCAQALFFAQGYEATTVNDIIVSAGLSKGAFYHYFESKEALLDALAERLAVEGVRDAQSVLEDRRLDALERLNAFLAQERQWKIEHAPMIRAVFAAVFKPENVVLYHRLVVATGRVVVPVLADLIEQGVREGVFDTPAPHLAAEVLLQLGYARQSIVADALSAAEAGEMSSALARLEARFAEEEALIARMLGIEAGRVRMVEPGFLRAILAAMRNPPLA